MKVIESRMIVQILLRDERGNQFVRNYTGRNKQPEWYLLSGGALVPALNFRELEIQYVKTQKETFPQEGL